MNRLRRMLAGAAALAITTGGIGIGAIGLGATAAQAAEGAVKDAVFEWSINDESTGGAYFGGCNFLAAGKAGDAGSSKVWSKGDYESLLPLNDKGQSVDGNVSAVKTDGSLVDYDNKCRTAGGTSVNGKVNSQAANNHTGDSIRIEGGTGTIDPETNSGTIQWKGSFTIVYYGGMTYWTITDPKLEVTNGKGRFTGTYSGVGADMDDPSIWIAELPSKNDTIIDFQNTTVDLGTGGFTATPDFLGVKSNLKGRNPQTEKDSANESWWGSFPDAWVEFNQLTNQDSYWFTSAGGASSIQPRKVTNPVKVSYDYIPDTAPSAQPRYTEYPQGYGGSEKFAGASQQGADAATIAYSNLGDWKGEQVTIKAGDDVLKAVDAAPAGSGGDTASEPSPRPDVIAEQGRGDFRVDISGLAVGVYDLSFLIAGEPIRTFTPDPEGNPPEDPSAMYPLTAKLAIVKPLTGSPHSLDATNHTSSSIYARWTPADRSGRPSSRPRPTSYLITADPSGSGQPVEQLVPGAYTDANIWNLAADTEHSITVEARIADVVWGPSEAITARTDKAPPTSGGGNTDGGDDGPADDGPGSPDGNDPGDSGPTFYWGLNHESNSGAFYGGCNFLVAGAAGDTGTSRLWQESDGFYKTSAGNVSVEKPNSSGQWSAPSWGSKCQDRNGRAVSTTQHIDSKPWTETRIKITGGELERDDSGAVTVQWTGSFTVAYYGGMTYWFASDPKLELDAEGNGRVTATASGYGADMVDTDKWNTLKPRTITLADLKGVDMAAAESDGGFEKTPEYLGVRYSGSGQSAAAPGGGETASAQAPKSAANEKSWGSFPSSFVDFQNETGQFSYWFSSDGARDPYKPATPLAVGYTGDFNPAPPGGGGTDPNASSGSGSGPGSGSRNGPGSTPNAKSPGQAATDADARPASQAAGEGFDFGELSPLNPWVWGLSGATVAAIGGLNWAVWSFIRRRIGLDPRALL